MKNITKIKTAIILTITLVTFSLQSYAGNTPTTFSSENSYKSEFTVENEILLEDWMVDMSSWNSIDLALSVETETDIELEEWMLSTAKWSKETADQESDIALEEWMTDLSKWK